MISMPVMMIMKKILSLTLTSLLVLPLFVIILVHIPTSNSLLLTTTANSCTSTSCKSRHHNPLLLASMTNPNPNHENHENHENNNDNKHKPKKLILIRHGRTYMNEYLSQPGCEWGDKHFTDIFPNPKAANVNAHANQNPDFYYRDSPLSPDGVRQAQLLSSFFGQTQNNNDNDNDNDNDYRVEDIELVVVSPLTRALQTVELGLMPHLVPTNAENHPNHPVPVVPVMALPLATERNYLLSDIGTPTSLLSLRFPYIDFQSQFHNHDNQQSQPQQSQKNEWWFTTKNDNDKDDDEYVEWRPNQQGQTYAHPGEPDHIFHERMVALYDWLDDRTESCLCLVCHWGVLQWLTGESFENCQVRVVSFDQLRRTGFVDLGQQQQQQQEEEELKQEMELQDGKSVDMQETVDQTRL